tara:strand:+ start:231627 stop:233654 length:2028 start_codon:yes stop_codon:yes gene_type:complete
LSDTSILLLILVFFLSLGIAFFQYLFPLKKQAKHMYLLFVLRSLSFFLLFVLLINPKINSFSTIVEKPILNIVVDNSKSIDFFKESKNVKQSVERLQGNADLQNKFDIRTYLFGNGVILSDSLDFTNQSTNIYKSLESVKSNSKGKNGATILLTDGNQTNGNAYEFINFKQPLYPLVFGDTTKYSDVKIDQVNTNKYSFLNNSFPVEILASYEGFKETKTQLVLRKGGKTLFKRTLNFSASEKAQLITTNIKSSQVGTHFYEAFLTPIANEKNTTNNKKRFSIEVINEETEIAIVASGLHPDMGALKRSIESNKQRKVSIVKPKDFDVENKNIKLVILYQPDPSFRDLMRELNELNANYLLITGTNTNWNFINRLELGFTKQAINSNESYGATFNPKFLEFYQEDIGFDEYPPLEDKYGKLSFQNPYQTFLFQNINGIQTNQPLVASLQKTNQKSVVIFGEGLWKWRAGEFLKSNSFQEFDTFINTLLQYTIKKEFKNRLEINYETIYPANSKIVISALYYDNTFKFDPRVALELKLKNKADNKVTVLPFSLKKNRYEIELENLFEGEYDFEVTVVNEKVSKKGTFRILKYSIEEQFTSSNYTSLQQLATNTNAAIYLKSDLDSLITAIANNQSFFKVEKSKKETKELIHWKWLLFLIVLLLAFEWFTRKYFGKI